MQDNEEPLAWWELDLLNGEGHHLEVGEIVKVTVTAKVVSVKEQSEGLPRVLRLDTGDDLLRSQWLTVQVDNDPNVTIQRVDPKEF